MPRDDIDYAAVRLLPSKSESVALSNAHAQTMTQAAARQGGARAWLQSFANYFEPRLIAVLFMGFSSGLPLALSSGTLQVWQTRSGVSLATIGFFALVGVAYNLKFAWAPLMDRVPPPGPLARLGRRRGWAVTTQLGLIVSLLLLGTSDPASSPIITALWAVLVAFCSASQDIVIDAYRIELLDEQQQGAGVAMTQYGYRLGMLASGAGALYLAAHLPWFVVYAVMAALVGIGIVAVLLTREPSQSSFIATDAPARGWRLRVLALAGVAIAAIAVFFFVKLLLARLGLPAWVPFAAASILGCATPVAIVMLLPHSAAGTGKGSAAYAELRSWLDSAVLSPFGEFASRPGWVAIMMFIVLYKLGDAVAGGMSNSFYVQIGFSNEEIAGVSKIFGLFPTLIGVFIGGLLVARIGIMPALLVGGVLQMLSNLMFSAQAAMGHDVHFLMLTIGIENLAGGIGTAAFVAYLSALCNVAFTGTQYALFSSLMAVGRTVLSSPSGVLAEQFGWFNYFLVATALAIPGLLVLLWMMRRYPVEQVAAAR